MTVNSSADLFVHYKDPKCDVLKTFLILNTMGRHFCTANLGCVCGLLSWCFVVVVLSRGATAWNTMQELLVFHSQAVLLWAKGSSHLKLLQKRTDWHSADSLSLSTASRRLIVIILFPALSVYIRCSRALGDALFNIKTQQSWRVLLPHSLLG